MNWVNVTSLPDIYNKLSFHKNANNSMQICVRNVITNNNEIVEVVQQRHLLYNRCQFKEAPSVKQKQTNYKGIYINFVLSPVRGIPQ